MKEFIAYLAGAAVFGCSMASADDWTCWGGDGHRNMVNDVEKGLPAEWDIKTGKSVRTFDAKELNTYSSGQRVDYGGVRSLSLSPGILPRIPGPDWPTWAMRLRMAPKRWSR